MEKKSYNTLDAFKFLAAILIIVLHVNPFKGISEPLALIFRNMITIIAVPFFFTTSGFLFFKKLDASESKGEMVKKYILRLLKMYLIWSLVYFPFVVLQWINEGVNVLGYIRDFIFEGSYSTIWFLNATIAACLFVYFLSRKIKLKYVLLISFLFYLIGCGFSYYYYLIIKIPLFEKCGELYYSLLKTTKNGLLFGAVFFALGAILANDKLKMDLKWNIIGLAVSFAFVCAESIIVPKLGYLNKGVDLKIFLVPFTYFLVKLLATINLPNHKIYKWFRGMSINMFLSQRLFLSIYPLIIPSDCIIISFQLIYFILILVSTCLFSWLMLVVVDKINQYKKSKQKKENFDV